MTLTSLVDALGLQPVTPVGAQEVKGAIASDLISSVLAHADEGDVWITIQTHQNVAAVAATQELAAVILASGREPSAELLELAASEQVPILCTEATTYDICGRLYALGVR